MEDFNIKIFDVVLQSLGGVEFILENFNMKLCVGFFFVFCGSEVNFSKCKQDLFSEDEVQ